MMKKAILLLSIIIGFNIVVHTQTADTTAMVDLDFIEASKPAEFKDGVTGWLKFLEKNLKTNLGKRYLKIPKGENSTTQTVKITFTIDTVGLVSNVTVVNSDEVHPKLAAEVLRVMNLSPKWQPAELNGKKVLFRHMQNITFQVSRD